MQVVATLAAILNIKLVEDFNNKKHYEINS